MLEDSFLVQRALKCLEKCPRDFRKTKCSYICISAKQGLRCLSAQQVELVLGVQLAGPHMTSVIIRIKYPVRPRHVGYMPSEILAVPVEQIGDCFRADTVSG